jgi:hypothetical protein
MWVCSVDAVPLTGPLPAVWISDVDATDEAAGIHCGPVPFGSDRALEQLAKRIGRIVLP